MMSAQAQMPNPGSDVLFQQAAQLRQRGPKGLQTFLLTHGNQLSNQAVATLPPLSLRTALDRLCQQRDCHASRLYWYTDLEQAKAAAKASGKPILSLRLLGRLDEELSCANSRFFRVALYPNGDISSLLRERFILHWQSVRPVPTATVDFGDGRKLVRTLTGNSIHYILNAEGRPIEAIPGLYGPQAFLRQLKQAEQAVREYNQRPQPEREGFLRQYHRDRLAAIQTQWANDLKQVGIASLPELAELPRNLDPSPTAMDASRIAVTKAAIETPLLSAFQFAAQNQRTLTDSTEQSGWNKLAERYAADAKLDLNSLNLIQAKKLARTTASKTKQAHVLEVAREFETVMALDTIRNEYLLHSQIHQWFMAGSGTENVNTLNDRVYDQLFLTPGSDPWLGLSPDSSYSAIENDGIHHYHPR
jgi:hypothetical protein